MAIPDSEPAHTYRGHALPITSLCISNTTGRIYSASLDSTIGVWAIPAGDGEAYTPFDPAMNIGRLEGHTDGVWDVCLLEQPSTSTETGQSVVKEMIATASADGTVKIWDVTPNTAATTTSSGPAPLPPGGSLRLSWTHTGTDGEDEEANADPEAKKTAVVPTSLALCQDDMTKLAVAYQDAKIRIFEVATGKLLMTLKGDESYGES